MTISNVLNTIYETFVVSTANLGNQLAHDISDGIDWAGDRAQRLTGSERVGAITRVALGATPILLFYQVASWQFRAAIWLGYHIFNLRSPNADRGMATAFGLEAIYEVFTFVMKNLYSTPGSGVHAWSAILGIILSVTYLHRSRIAMEPLNNALPPIPVQPLANNALQQPA